MGSRGDVLLEFDWSVGEVMAALKRLGLDKNTIVILSSDNGPVVDDGYKDNAVELLGEHKPAGVYRGGKYSNYEAGTRVPCLVRWKSHIVPGVSDNLMSQLDWFSSFADMLKVTVPVNVAPDSENHLDAWLDVAGKGRSFVVTQNDRIIWVLQMESGSIFLPVMVLPLINRRIRNLLTARRISSTV